MFEALLTASRGKAERPELAAWNRGKVRCLYPMGDPARDAAILRDGPVERIEA